MGGLREHQRPGFAHPAMFRVSGRNAASGPHPELPQNPANPWSKRKLGWLIPHWQDRLKPTPGMQKRCVPWVGTGPRQLRWPGGTSGRHTEVHGVQPGPILPVSTSFGSANSVTRPTAELPFASALRDTRSRKDLIIAVLLQWEYKLMVNYSGGIFKASCRLKAVIHSMKLAAFLLPVSQCVYFLN